MCQLEKTKFFDFVFCRIRGFDGAAAAKNHIQSEVERVCHQIIKKFCLKKVKLTRKLQVKFKTAKREMFAKCRKKFFSEIFIRK